MSDFERDFLNELNQKMFPLSLEQVRKQNLQECQNVLRQAKISSTIDPILLRDNNFDISSSKLLVYEHLYFLPEEV